MLGLGIAKKTGLSKLIDKLNIIRAKLIFNLKLRQDKKEVSIRNKQKIFVIGFNKTGTTSLESALLEFDIIVGHQRTAEKLMGDIMVGKTKSLIEYCKTAEAFQDTPFSLPNTYKLIDQAYPNSKFILSVRDTPNQWFNSMVQFHSKLWGKNDNAPTEDDLDNANYVYKGYPLKTMKYVYGNSIYDKKIYTDIYNKHNQEVKDYFSDKNDKLLVLNISSSSSYKDFCKFIGEKPLRETFEWKNKTSEK